METAEEKKLSVSEDCRKKRLWTPDGMSGLAVIALC